MMHFEPGSFRDRASRVFLEGNEVYRTLDHNAASTWRTLSTTSLFTRLTDSGKIVETEELSEDQRRQFPLSESAVGVLRHARIPFISYPYEWCFGMLREATLLHLNILTESMKSGLILKDASPFNVQFRGTNSVFIDIGSFVPIIPGEPWTAYRQFCEMMLFPLMLQAYRGVHFQPILRGQLEGIPARQFMQWIRWRDIFRPGVLTNGWLQAGLEKRTQSISTSTVRDLQASGFTTSLIEQMLTKLTRLVEGLRWVPEKTQWTQYDNSLPHVAEDGQKKAEFVRTVCQVGHRQLVWDLGCNDGRYSMIAREFATTVLAVDQDHACIERLFQTLGNSQTTILPLCMDIANQSPALGWRGKERKRIEDRGRPDLVLCLGLIHHLVLASNIPLSEVINWLASFSADIVLEFPSKQDAMVQAMLRNKKDQYDDYSIDLLEVELNRYFDVRQRQSLPSGHRVLFHLTPKILTNENSDR